MGKSNKPTKWFKAVKKAFRSPSKERPNSQDATKVGADEKVLSSHDLSPASHQVAKPHPLPSFETTSFDEAEPDQTPMQHSPRQETENPDTSVTQFPNEDEDEVEEDEIIASNDGMQAEEKHQDDDDYSYVSEEEEAAIRIKQRFGGPLALRGLIRLQALVRGHQVRRQAATTLRVIEALVRIQARVRGHQGRMSKEGQAVHIRILRRRQLNSRPSKPGDGRWDASRGTLQDKNAQTSSREEGVRKRERAKAYAFSQQLKNSIPNRSSSYIDCEPGHLGWTWLERWTIARPWEIHQLEDSKEFIEIIPSHRNSGYTSKEIDASTLKMKSYGNLPSPPISSKSLSLSSPSEKRESQFAVPHQQRTTRVPKFLPVPLPSPPAGSTNTQSHLAMSKPPPLEVPSQPAMEEDEDAPPQEPRTPDAQKSPRSDNSISAPVSPALSDTSLPVPPSPEASDASLPVPETPPDVGSTEVDQSAVIEGLVLPEAHEVNEGETNGASSYQGPGIVSANGVHGEDSPTLNKSASDAFYEHTDNGHIETGHSNGEKIGENGDSPLATGVKPTKCRYMAATESAKAKFRSLSNPKTRSPDVVESPVKQTKRYSHGGGQLNKTDSPKIAFGTHRSSSFQTRGSPAPKIGHLKEKSHQLEAGAESPARRNSYGGADSRSGIRWRS